MQKDPFSYNEPTRFTSDNQPQTRRGKSKTLVKEVVKDMVLQDVPQQIELMAVCEHCGAEEPVTLQLPTIESLIEVQIERAAQGDTRAFEALVNRIEGKPVQPIQMEEPVPEERYDFSLLTPEQFAELTEYLTRCKIAE